LADLLLTKLQVVELNEKDALDVVSLVESHEVGHGPGDQIDLDRLVEATAAEWGLWRTVHLTVARVDAMAPAVVRDRLATIVAAIDEAPKPLGWRARARIGDRKRWYQVPEEVGR
jgi:hypothetical protein